MSVKASQQLLLRRYAYDSVQTIYNNTNKTLPESVQNKINQIKEELEIIYKESEKKNKRHQFKKHNGYTVALFKTVSLVEINLPN